MKIHINSYFDNVLVLQNYQQEADEEHFSYDVFLWHLVEDKLNFYFLTIS